jgi:hypothetical protein
MKRLLLLPLLLLGGCSSGPSGGPDPRTNAPNRLTVTLTLSQAINNTNYYYFGFDDDDDSTDGPVAIVTSTDVSNGVITGSRRVGGDENNPNAAQGLSVIVAYRAGQFNAFRRTPRANAQETLERFPGAFTGSVPFRASGNRITFTLDLDARNSNGNFLFRHNSNTPGDLAFSSLDTNFVTTNQVIFNSQDLRPKPFDAFGPNDGSGPVRAGTRGNVYETYDIRSSRTGPAAYTQADTRFGEPSGDVFNADGSLPDANERGRLDINAFSIEVRREVN